MQPFDLQTMQSSLLFSGMPANLQEELARGATIREFERGSTIFVQGEQATALYIVVEGWVKLFRVAPHGTEAVVGVFTRGRSFGEAVALRHDVYPVSAEAVTSCRVIRILADDFLRGIRDNPEMAVSALSATYAHLHNLVAQIEALKARTGAQRVAEFLLELTSCDTGPCEVVLPYDKVLIAGRLGMKPESLSRAFSKLKEHGVKITQNRAVIDDAAMLRTFSEEDPAASWSRQDAFVIQVYGWCA